MLPCFVIVPHGESLIKRSYAGLDLVKKSANAVKDILVDACVQFLKKSFMYGFVFFRKEHFLCRLKQPGLDFLITTRFLGSRTSTCRRS